MMMGVRSLPLNFHGVLYAGILKMRLSGKIGRRDRKSGSLALGLDSIGLLHKKEGRLFRASLFVAIQDMSWLGTD